ncbi:MAG TPA: hypothetical protein VFH72_12050 [Candidatus Baltobacteraceae bacterium]|nr:hypothetical protein [Candidatus Baltobacteraceae bacterium]
MARWCRAFVQFAFALVLAHGSVTIRWNASAPAPSAGPPRNGVVSAVHGTRVLLRLTDGTSRVFIATPAQARQLQRLVGTAIQFRLTVPR